MGLTHLPTEILLLISDRLDPANLSVLVRTCRRLSHVLGSELEGRAADHLVEYEATVLHWAAENGREQLALRLLNRGIIEVDQTDSRGWTPLISATAADQSDMISLLIRMGAGVNARSRYGHTPLWIASQRRSADTTRILAEAGGDVSALNSSRFYAFNPLLAALQHIEKPFGRRGDELNEIVRILLDAGADPNFVDGHGKNALGWAVTNGRFDLIQLLLDRGAEFSHDVPLYAAMELAISQHSNQLLECLLQFEPDIEHAMTYSIHGDKLGIFLFLAGIEPNILQEQGNKDRYLVASVLSNSVEIAKYLLSEGASPFAHRGGDPILHVGLQAGHEHIVRLLLEHGADPHAASLGYNSVLHAAVDGEQLSIARHLIEQGVSIDSKNMEGWTPLFAALQQEKLAMANLLHEAGADITETDQEGRPLLHALFRKTYLNILVDMDAEITDWLLDRGLDINLQDNDLRTVLHEAVEVGYVEIVQMLLERGADPTILSNEGTTALDMAMRKAEEQSTEGVSASDRRSILELLDKYVKGSA